MPTILPTMPNADEPMELEQGSSLWRDAWHRLSKNKIAVFGGVTLIVLTIACVFGPLLSSYSYEDQDLYLGASAPSAEHWLGTDTLGRDLMVRLLVGGRISIGVGLCATLVALTIGVVYGATAGFFGGKIDAFMMRIVDILMAVPYMFVIILLLVIFGRSISMLFVGIGLLSWLEMSRIVRGQTLSIKNKEFIEAAQATGVPGFLIIVRHIVPNLMGVVAVYATLLVPLMILTESFISFLGLGVQEPDTSWGALIFEGAGTMQYGTLWQLAFPLFFFVITLFAFFFVGDGLRDALDPKDR